MDKSWNQGREKIDQSVEHTVTCLNWLGTHRGVGEHDGGISALWSTAGGDEDEVGARAMGHDSSGGWWHSEEKGKVTLVTRTR